MQLEPDKVYLLRRPIATAEADFEDYRELASTALAGLDFELPKSGSVVLKANATVLFPAVKRIVTHPGFLAGIVDALVVRGVAAERIVVGDGQSPENPDDDKTWEGAGYTEMVRSRGVMLLPFNETDSRPVPVPGGEIFSEFPIYRTVTDCAFFMNVPLAKCHNLGCTTLNVKNLMGVLGTPERHLCAVQEVDLEVEDDLWRLTGNGLSLFEHRFYQKLCDSLAAFRGLGIPRLCVVDGLIGRDGTAFNEGDNYPLGCTVIGENEVNVDAVTTYLMGLDPQVTPYLEFARERGLGTNDVGQISVVDIATDQELTPQALAAARSERVFMPTCSSPDGYYDRFRADGSVVPWRLGDVNEQRLKDGLEPISAV